MLLGRDFYNFLEIWFLFYLNMFFLFIEVSRRENGLKLGRFRVKGVFCRDISRIVESYFKLIFWKLS